METTVNKTIEQEALMFLEDGMSELRLSIQRAKNMLLDGKVIQCNQKLQGSLTKCDNAIKYIQEVRTGDANAVMVTENSPEASKE